MLKNVSVMVTDECNSHCSMCDIWKGGVNKSALSADQFRRLFSGSDFSELEDISITGGEPTLREDLMEVIEAIVAEKVKLRMLFLCSNGTNPKKAEEFVRRFRGRISEIFVAVSLEGTREATRAIRGIDSYDSALETVRICKGVSEAVHTIFSATITPINCDALNLNHLRQLASDTGSTFSFKPVIVNGAYYRNERRDGRFSLNQTQVAFLQQFIEDYCMRDPFMRIQLDYLRKGETGVKCLAGDVFAFVRPTGDIKPCCNSTRVIGGLDQRLSCIDDLGRYEPCPCCNEMCVYPSINWAQFSSKKHD